MQFPNIAQYGLTTTVYGKVADDVVLLDCSTASITYFLPNLKGTTTYRGWSVICKRQDASANTVSVTVQGVNNKIEYGAVGTTTIHLAGQNVSKTFVWDYINYVWAVV